VLFRSRGSVCVGAQGMPAPLVQARTGSGIRLVRRLGDGNLSPVDQIVVYDNDGNPHHIRLSIGMSGKALLDKVRELNIKSDKPIEIDCAEGAASTYEKLLHQAFPGCRFEWVSNTASDTRPVRARVTLKCNDRYFRSIAKIAFHYYLAHSVRSRGNEKEFSPLREFIMHGGDRHPFFDARLRFAMPQLPAGLVPGDWFHYVAEDESEGSVYAYVNLFVGPRKPEGNPHHLCLGKLSSAIVLPGKRCGHIYKYDTSAGPGAKVGEVAPALLERRR